MQVQVKLFYTLWLIENMHGLGCRVNQMLKGHDVNEGTVMANMDTAQRHAKIQNV